jgi:hypothetical protein
MGNSHHLRAQHYEKTVAAVRFHEAGHAVAALACGFALHEIEISGLPRAGYCDTNMTRAAPLADQLVILLAGREAERRFWPGCYEYGGQDDLRRATDLVRSRASAAELMDEARRRADQIITKHWAAITALVNRLADCRGTLSGAEATAIAKAASPGIDEHITRTVPPVPSTRSRTGTLSSSNAESGTMNVLKDGRTIGEIVRRDYGGFDAFRLVRGDLKRVGRYRTAAEAARAV